MKSFSKSFEGKFPFRKNYFSRENSNRITTIFAANSSTSKHTNSTTRSILHLLLLDLLELHRIKENNSLFGINACENLGGIQWRDVIQRVCPGD